MTQRKCPFGHVKSWREPFERPSHAAPGRNFRIRARSAGDRTPPGVRRAADTSSGTGTDRGTFRGGHAGRPGQTVAPADRVRFLAATNQTIDSAQRARACAHACPCVRARAPEREGQRERPLTCLRACE